MGWDLFIGIDYSGAETPEARLKGLQLYAARPGHKPEAVTPPDPDGHAYRNWSRQAIAHWLRDQLQSDQRLFIGIDHGFSFPEALPLSWGEQAAHFKLQTILGKMQASALDRT